MRILTWREVFFGDTKIKTLAEEAGDTIPAGLKENTLRLMFALAVYILIVGVAIGYSMSLIL